MSSEPTPPPILRDPNSGLLRSALHAFYGALWWLAIGLGSVWWVSRSLYDLEFRRMVRGRLGFGLPSPPRAGERRRLLIHGVSVGEIKAAQALVLGLERERPDLEVVISTVTDTGFKIARELYTGRRIVRFPVDPGWIVERFLRRVQPVCVILIELEIWPNFLRAANGLGIPVAVVNGRITEASYGSYRHFRNLLPQFNRISLYCVQAEEYGRRFASLSGAGERILVTGNVKADSLGESRVEPGSELRRLLSPAPGQLVVTAGSTHENEELQLVRAWRESFPEARLILVPRHPPRAPEVERRLRESAVSAQLLSSLRAGDEPDPSRPAIVDTIGELERVYGLSDVVFIGGSLVPHGGQNMLEPAAQGLPVVYGPHVENFLIEAGLLERAGGGLRLADSRDLGACLAQLLADPGRRRAMAVAGLAVVRAQKGATRRTLEALEQRCLPRASAAGAADLPSQASQAAPRAHESSG
jgi:3-deoxy-D-manno-octulosonic-acid transferase